VYKFHIQNETVRMNIALIVDSTRHQRRLNQRRQSLEFVIDLKTGKLSLLPTTPVDHRVIQIHLDLDQQQVYVTDTRNAKEFNLEEMAPQGRQVLAETCHCLKTALMQLHDINEFTHVEFDPSVEKIVDRNFVQEAWHVVEREEAELMLLNTKPGTYLFRKDRFAGLMEEMLSAAKRSRIRCFTLCYLDPSKQVRERTIVNWNSHWLFYDDDPTLSGHYFESLEHLLTSMRTVLKIPLPALKAAN
jgi:hypothetical protein